MAEFLRRELKNGIVIVMEKRDLPIVSASITNKFGAGYEGSEIKGLAHFIEHLLFTGTKNRTHEDISREIEKHGGILNAFTINEVTSFWFKLPSDHLFTGFDILVDMLKNTDFKLEKFEKEKKVILEEIKMYHDNPQRAVYEEVHRNLYENPFGEGVIGSADTVSSLKREFVMDYFKKAYVPSNYIVTVVGNANFEEVCSYFEKNFSAAKEKPLLQIKPTIKNKESTEERAGIDQANFVFAIHAPVLSKHEHAALEVLNEYLARGASSKLYLKIREELGLAYSVQGGIFGEKNYAFYHIYVGTTKESLSKVKKEILNAFKAARNMNAKELNQAKAKLIGSRRLATEDSVNVMNELMMAEYVFGNAERYYSREKEIGAVTLEQIKKLATITEYSSAAIVPN